MRALVAVLGCLGQELHHDPGEGRRQVRIEGMGVTGAWATWQCSSPRASAGKRRPAHEQPVEGGPQGIEIGTVVDATVHAPGLFRRDIGQVPLDGRRRLQRDLALGKLISDAEADEPELAAVRVHDNVGRVDVLVHDPLLMQTGQGLGQTDRQIQELLQGELLAGRENPIQRFTADILQLHHHAAVRFRKPESLDDTVQIDPA